MVTGNHNIHDLYPFPGVGVYGPVIAGVPVLFFVEIKDKFGNKTEGVKHDMFVDITDNEGKRTSAFLFFFLETI